MKLKDIRGNKYSRLFVLEYLGGQDSLWRCICDCGNPTLASGSDLRRRTIQSCGCLARESSIASGRAKRIHGHCLNGKSSREHSSWIAMKKRCNSPGAHAYDLYGGAGVTVCERWMSFVNFLTDMGPRPANTELGRLGDIGNYEPGNCKWMTRKEQYVNRRHKLVRWV